GGDGGDHLVADLVDVGSLVAFGLGRQRVGAKERGRNVDRAQVAEPACCSELALLRWKVQAVAGFDLDGRHAFGNEGVEARQRAPDELVLARGTGGRDGGEDTASRLSNLGVARALEPHLELAGAVAGVDESRMAVDQPRRAPAPAAVDRLARRKARRQIGARPRIGNAAVLSGDGAIVDPPVLTSPCNQRRETRVGPEPIAGCRFASHVMPLIARADPLGLDLRLAVSRPRTIVGRRAPCSSSFWNVRFCPRAGRTTFSSMFKTE